jgi:hypothetical protein
MRTATLLALAAFSVGFSAVLFAQTATRPAATPPARGAGRAARLPPPPPPRVTPDDIDARFGTPYSTATPWRFTADYSTKAAWEKRADFVRHQAIVAEGLWPTPPRVPLNAVIYGKIDKPEYTVEKVYFTSLPGHYVTGSLYRPKNTAGKVPAILTPYGHWGNGPANGGRFWTRDEASAQREITSGAEKDLSNAEAPLQASCTELARMGCIAFQWDLVGYCDSSVIKHQEGFTDPEAVLHLQSFMGLQAWNTSRAIDFVSSLPDVDATRIGISGSSGGGTQSFIAGTVDSRLAGLFPICMVGPDSQGGCICENTSLLRVNTNNIEFAATFAPKPQFDVSANDFTKNFLTIGLPEMKKIYALEDASAEYGSEHFPFGHNHNAHSRQAVYEAINKDFKLGLPTPIVEKPFDVLTKDDLTVWTKEHPLPSDFGDAGVVRAWMTNTAAEQLAALAKNPDDYRNTLKIALEAMVDDQLPEPADVESTVDLHGTAGEGFFTRKAARERVPFSFQKPANWNGAVVIVSDPDGAKAAADPILKSRAMLVSLTPFESGDFKRPTPPRPTVGMRMDYSGYANGYERTTLANRTHDLLSLIALVKGTDGVKSVRLLGAPGSAPQALLAAALAGPAIDRAALDLHGFDFTQIKDANDPNFLPGALKYGGVKGFVNLISTTKILADGIQSPQPGTPLDPADITVESSSRTPSDLATWLLH